MEDHVIENYNVVKDEVIRKLISEGVITKKTGKKIMIGLHVILYKPCWFNKAFRKYVKHKHADRNEEYIKVVKLVS